MARALSKHISKIKAIWRRLSDKEYRGAFAEAHVSDRLAAQIHYMRKHRGWTQEQLAQKAGKTQPIISSLELSCEGVTLRTLKRIASAFDVALDVRFVPFSELLSSEQRDLNSPVPPFEQDAPPLRGEFEFRISTAHQIGHVANIADTGKEVFNLPFSPRSKTEVVLNG